MRPTIGDDQISALRTDKHKKNKLLHHEGTKSTKLFNDSPLLRVLRDFVVRILGCGLRPH
jgi:hypothetical protein